MLEVYCSVFRVRSQLWAFRTAYLGNKSKVLKSSDNAMTEEGSDESGTNDLSLDGSEGNHSLLTFCETKIVYNLVFSK